MLTVCLLAMLSCPPVALVPREPYAPWQHTGCNRKARRSARHKRKEPMKGRESLWD